MAPDDLVTEQRRRGSSVSVTATAEAASAKLQRPSNGIFIEYENLLENSCCGKRPRHNN